MRIAGGVATLRGVLIANCHSLFEGAGAIELMGQWSIEIMEESGGKPSSLKMEDSVITNCTSQPGAGAIAASGQSIVTLLRTAIMHCRAIRPGTGFGGGLVIGNGALLTMVNSTIHACHATASGGGFYLVEYAAARIHGSSITACTALVRGGAVYIMEQSGLEIVASQISSSSSAGEAGALSVEDGSVVLMMDTRIADCHAETKGGGIGIRSSTVTLRASAIVECTAVDAGGLVSLEDGSLTLDKGNYSGGRSRYGGCLSVSAGSVTAHDSYFAACVAVREGGALFMQAGLANLADCIFSSSASLASGGVFTPLRYISTAAQISVTQTNG